MTQKLTAGVVICTRNRPQQIIDCLKSLASQTFPISQIIIVDSSEPPLNLDPHFTDYFGPQHFPQADQVYQHTSPGLTYQRNIGISNANADVIFFFDDDVIIYPNYVEIIMERFITTPNLGGGMGRITNLPSPKNSWGQYLRRFYLLQHAGAHGKLLPSGFPTHPHGRSAFMEVEILSGGMAAYRLEVLRNHLFDEYFAGYAYMEDVEYSYRVSQHYTLFYEPMARLDHHHPPAEKRDNPKIRKMYLVNHNYIFIKHLFPSCRLCILPYLWSIVGLFIFASLTGQWQSIKGYLQGIRVIVKSGADK